MSVWIMDLYVDVKHLLQPFGTICRYVKFVNVNTIYVSIFVIVNTYVSLYVIVNVYMCMKSVLFLQMSDFLKYRIFVQFLEFVMSDGRE
jgi:hypothetical protein